MSVNKLQNRGEFEQSPETEKWEEEKKYIPKDPHFFDFLEQVCEVQRIEQIYLSDVDEPYSLRVREITMPDGSVRHTSALKAEQSLVKNGVKRRETPVTNISAESFAFYQNSDRPRLFKKRVEPVAGVSVDWIDGYPLPIIEIEDLATNEAGQLFLQEYGSMLVDHSGFDDVDNEWIAHSLSKSERPMEKQMSVEEMAQQILGYRTYGISPIVATIDGRSGSGKTTYARQLEQLLRKKSIHATVLSTDNYHRGKSWLEAQNGGKPWQNWDASIVYNTKDLAVDIARLRGGESVENRFFSFNDQEPHYEGVVDPAEVIIVEGIHAGTKDLAGIRHFHFPVVTRFATAAGQDLSRLREGDRPNSTIGSTSDRLGYQIEVAEPTYQSLDRVSKKDLRPIQHMIGKKVVQIRNRQAL